MTKFSSVLAVQPTFVVMVFFITSTFPIVQSFASTSYRSHFEANALRKCQPARPLSPTWLHAKRGAKGQQNRGRRQHYQEGGTDTSLDFFVPTKKQLSIPKPSQTRPIVLSLSLPENDASLKVTAFEVKDREWWNENAELNPYGARLWPSSLALSEFLVSHFSETKENPYLLELGCGVGLVSLVAAEAGSTVMATDVSSIALSLTQQGWTATKVMNEKGRLGNGQGGKKGTLSTSIFDILASQPLPLAPHDLEEATSFENGDEKIQPIVIAGSIMYESILAKAMARRVSEACQRGAWVIIGDDDTGEREGGRALFLQEIEQLQQRPSLQALLTPTWTTTVVKHAGLGWTEKHVNLLHFNAPSNAAIS